MAQITPRDQAALARVARRHLKSLMRRQGVVDVGIGHRFRDGRLTGELAVVVRVDRKVALSRLPRAARVPRTVSGIRTDVIERNLTPLAGPHDRHDPLLGGVAIGTAAGSGTFGCIVFDRQTARPYGLTNHHVLFLGPPPPPPWYVTQPLVNTGSGHLVGEYARFHRGTDSGLFTLDLGFQGPRRLNTGILQSVSAPSRGTTAPIIGMPVQKAGATTGLTYGVIRYIGFVSRSLDVYVDRSRMPGVGPFSDSGDSGSVVTESATGAVVGLLSAGFGRGANRGGTATAIDAVLRALDCFIFDDHVGVWTPPSAWIGGGHMAFTIVAPHEHATLSVRYPSGRVSTAQGLGRKQADVNGMIVWTWIVGTSTQRRSNRQCLAQLKVGDRIYRSEFGLTGTTRYDR